MNGFEINAYWEVLKKIRQWWKNQPILSSLRLDLQKIQEADGAYVPVKYDFHHIFGHDQFEGRVHMVQNFANCTVKRKKDGTPMTKTYVS